MGLIARETDNAEEQVLKKLLNTTRIKYITEKTQNHFSEVRKAKVPLAAVEKETIVS